jgi:hypothetical protein
MHLVYFWPSPTSMARRERQLWPPTVQRWVGTVRFYVQNKGWIIISMQITTSFSLHSTPPSPHGRINAPSLLLAFAHIHGEAGTPTLATYSAVVGRNGPCLCLCRRGGRFPSCKTPPFSLHSTPPRLRTGESMHLVYFWPSPTSMARRERQLWPSTVQWWVGAVRVFVCAEGVDYYFHVKRPHSRYIRHHPVSARANQCT